MMARTPRTFRRRRRAAESTRVTLPIKTEPGGRRFRPNREVADLSQIACDEPEREHGGRSVFLAGTHDRGGKVGAVRRIGEVLRLEAQPGAAAVSSSALSHDRS